MADIVKVTFGILDAKGQSSRVVYHSMIDPYFTGLGGQYIEVLKMYFQEVAKRLDQYIMGSIVSINISVDCALPVGIKVAPLTNSDVEEGAEFKFPEGANTAYFRHIIPTFDHALFGYGQTTLAWEDISDYAMLLFQSEDAPSWPNEIGTITDNRGFEVNAPPRITKKFKPSR